MLLFSLRVSHGKCTKPLQIIHNQGSKMTFCTKIWTFISLEINWKIILIELIVKTPSKLGKTHFGRKYCKFFDLINHFLILLESIATRLSNIKCDLEYKKPIFILMIGNF